MALKPSHQTARKALPETATPRSRRLVLKTLSVAGLGTAVFGRALLALADVDIFVAPSFVGSHLLLTNLTGHPAVVVPNGFRASDGTPTSITFTGRLFRETDVLAVAHAFQQATDFHRKHPPIEKFLQESQNTG